MALPLPKRWRSSVIARLSPVQGRDGREPSVGTRKTIEGSLMSEDYAHGRRDGLRLALAILAAEEAKWSALLGKSRSWRTNATREVRHKTLQVAQKRVQTALSRLTPKGGASMSDELASALDKAGL